MRIYLFEDFETSKKFFVKAETSEKAFMIAYINFSYPMFICEVPGELAEMEELDTY